MVNLFGLGKPKCEQCKIELKGNTLEWEGKSFCCKECKHSYRIGNKGGKGSCH